MTIKTKTYLAKPKSGDSRLIKGYNAAQVGRYLASEWAISLATQDDLEALLPAGVKVEKAEAEEAKD